MTVEKSSMKIAFLCKRYYTNKDLISDQFGRNFELPKLLKNSGHEVVVFALDYKGKKIERVTLAGVQFLSLPVFSFSGVSGVFGALSSGFGNEQEEITGIGFDLSSLAGGLRTRVCA